MHDVELKDGRIVTIECWDFEDLKKHTLYKTDSEQKKNGNKMFDGFSYYGSDLINDLQGVNTERYCKAQGLSDFEKQEDPSLPNEHYHRAIVALQDQKLIGLLICQWTNNRYFPFWLYHMKFVDVNREFQNQSVATHLVEELDRTEFLDHKILYLGIFSNPGKRFLKPVCDRILNAENYALVTSRRYMDDPPTAPGIYAKFNSNNS
jgi:ribosomal protein S18 acetylase RimI-like enzyme